jgi:large conductance mechanosensitive channel
MRKIWKEFKEFAIKGNAIDLAVGVIIGAAFTGIINSLVKDIIMPPLSLLTGGLDFSNKFMILRAAKDGSMNFNTPADAAKAGAITLNYGNFITLAINFLIVAGAVFLMVRAINRLKQPKHAEPVIKDCPACAMTIPIKATRCPHCTTEFAGQTGAQPAAKTGVKGGPGYFPSGK